MTLINEAAYLYVYSKKVIAVNKRLHGFREDAATQAKKFHSTRNSQHQQKHHAEYQQLAEKIKKLLEERQEILKKLHRHQVAFAGQLQKESR